MVIDCWFGFELTSWRNCTDLVTSTVNELSVIIFSVFSFFEKISIGNVPIDLTG